MALPKEQLSFRQTIRNCWIWNKSTFHLRPIKKWSYLKAKSALRDAKIYAERVSNSFWKDITLESISEDLAKQGKLEEAFEFIGYIGSNRRKIHILIFLFGELSRQQDFEMAESALIQALECMNGITDDSDLSSALEIISLELCRQGRIDEAFDFACEIREDGVKNTALSGISIELAKQGNWQLAESVCLKIPKSLIRSYCSHTIGENSCNDSGWEIALKNIYRFRTEEFLKFYLKGIANLLNATDCKKEVILSIRRDFECDIESLSQLLFQLSLNEIFFNESTEQRMDRFNRTLNIQWAIDLKNSLNA